MKTLPFLASLVLCPCALLAEEIVEEKEGLIRIEAESTSSPLGNWKKKTTLAGYEGDAYLEFTGNTPTNGPADSPLRYRFRTGKGGLYFLHLRCARERVGERNDLANDSYVRLEGDFEAGPDPGDTHGDDAPLLMLKKDTKFFGGDHLRFVWASGNRLDPGGHNNKRVAVYRLEAGKEYALVVSGRSQLFKLDQILFRHDSVSKESAEKTSP